MLASTSAEVTLAKMCPHPVLRHYYYLFIGISIYWRLEEIPRLSPGVSKKSNKMDWVIETIWASVSQI